MGGYVWQLSDSDSWMQAAWRGVNIGLAPCFPSFTSYHVPLLRREQFKSRWGWAGARPGHTGKKTEISLASELLPTAPCGKGHRYRILHNIYFILPAGLTPHLFFSPRICAFKTCRFYLNNILTVVQGRVRLVGMTNLSTLALKARRNYQDIVLSAMWSDPGVVV